jgi:hypothetical protein
VRPPPPPPPSPPGPYRILANFGDEPWPLEGDLVLAAGELRDGALMPLAGAVVR